MKNKSTVISLLVVFSLICCWNLYWTWVQFDLDGQVDSLKTELTQITEAKKDKSTWTAEDSLVEQQYLQLTSDPEFRAKRDRAIKNSFTLGLDLQGGMFVTLEVKLAELIRGLAANKNNPQLNAAIQCANEKAKTVSANYIDLFVQCFAEQNPDGKLGAIFANVDMNISIATPNDEVAQILRTEADAATDRTFEILRTRIDGFGVVSPNLQKQESTGRILMELPGVREPKRVRDLIVKTANLEFYVGRPFYESYPVLVNINQRMRELEGIETATDSTEETTDAEAGDAADDEDEEAAIADSDTSATDSAGETFSTTDEESDTTSFENLSEAEQERRREEFRRENPLWAVLGALDYQAMAQAGLRTPRVAVASANDTAAVNAILNKDEIKELIPADMKFAWSFKPITGEDGVATETFELISLLVNPDGTAALEGDVVASARNDIDPQSGRNIISMRMTPEGTSEWGRLTTNNVNNYVAILLDDKVYSYPTVNEPIMNGNSQISGDFTPEEAKDLANVLGAGKLDVTPVIAGEETVGPTLGEANIKSGMFSFLAAFVVVMIFMAFYYAKAGLWADVALLANLAFILGCSAAFTIVLTLPGIAAVVLTVGMAVDANVLIFERIREEQAKGKTLKASIKAGFDNAFSSVMDANITTFLTGVVLFAFGVGPIRGFAVALMIGIITSLISALIITRLILESQGSKGKESINFGYPFTTGLFDKLSISMVARRKTFYIVSGVLVAASIALMVSVGFKLGVDFKGGRQFVVEFTEGGQAASLDNGEVESIRKDLNTAFENTEPVIKTLEASNQVMVTTSYKVDDREATNEVSDALMAGLGDKYGNAKIVSTSDVGPTVASDIRDAAFLSVIFSLLIIFFYILVRFRKWQYSAGAVIAVFHDVLITLGIFSLLSLFPNLPFNVEINQALIAALLTIVGYSINDTVVVFDRIRENIGEMKSVKLADIYNVSIDQTLSRTLITSVTTLLTALILFIFGGDVIRGFIFAIIIGIIVGTYSSIFVASPISLDLIEREDKEKEGDKAKA
ncbi:protein translocase subunit SecDF [Pontibacter sp. G13]|uniref:protein translocase subunit SecDF n=1 Tax=Pontibacter sp. G13 TaxID=3074898 RepID=UPI00288BE3DF|nr:protein translocase subunit SecDF [Pontibacter sp. G13]WNJ17685.1 protein translocase subunit SecDF [Pontibacter sp. G13]